MQYICSVCQAKIEGDVLTLKNHSEQHIVELIRRDHPNWVADDGMCHKCYDYYRREINGPPLPPAEEAPRPSKEGSVLDGIRKWFGGRR